MFEQVRSEASMTALLIVLLATLTAATSIAHEGEHEASSFTGEDEVVLGTIDFPTSAGPEAQAAFIRGVLYLHSFEYAPAAREFQKAQAIEPDFAMAFWGEAMTQHHSLWRVQHLEAATKILDRLGATNEERAKNAKTERERSYLRAVEILFGLREETRGLGKLERDLYYRNEMKRVHEAYPDDLEARAFYGLSILGVGSANREYATYMKAAAVITPVWDANHSHPGAAHYLIHSYDDPIHAILGLPMARAYEEIALGAAHAQHMTSHIYVALGLWDEVVRANITALAIESAKTDGEGFRSREAWHHRYWLHYGRLQQGLWDEAREILEMARERVALDPLPREPSYYGAMYARYLIDTESWEKANEWLAAEDVEIQIAHYFFARAFAAAKLGELDRARELMNQIREGGEGNPEIRLSRQEVDILKLEVEVVIALAERHKKKSVELARRAVELQAGLPFRYGPPRISKPTGELLGDVLLELGDDEGAILAYQDQLSRSQLRTNSLLGLARASARAGEGAISMAAYASLAEIWHRADADLPALIEVREQAKAP
jgi:hypothetical protein